MVYVFLADGFEEMEALSPVDILLRAGVEVTTVGITGEYVTGAHGIIVKSDAADFEMNECTEMIVLPGGGRGTANLSASEKVRNAIEYAKKHNVKMAAICAAPSVLGENGVLVGRRAACFPEPMFTDKLKGAEYVSDGVCADNGVVTARSAGHAVNFGIELVRQLKGDDAAEKIRVELFQNA